MKNKTASTLSTVAYVIWILGGIGSIMISISIADTFSGTMLENLGNSISFGMFFVTAFNIFSTGLIFYALSIIINMLEKTSQVIEVNKIETPSIDKQSDDVFKF